jgi:nitrite reductase/ring-hydroxylating ferredoxin subunit
VAGGPGCRIAFAPPDGRLQGTRQRQFLAAVNRRCPSRHDVGLPAAGAAAGAAGNACSANSRVVRSPMRLGHLLPVKWRSLIRETELTPGEVQVRKVLWYRLGAVRVHGRIYVFEGSCPHRGRSLQGGAVTSQGIIECPWHGLQLSLGPPPCPAGAMPVTPLTFRVRNGVIAIDRSALRRLNRAPRGGLGT